MFQIALGTSLFGGDWSPQGCNFSDELKELATGMMAAARASIGQLSPG